MNWKRLIDLLCRTPPGDLVAFGLELAVRTVINAAVGAVAGMVIVWVGARVLTGCQLRWRTAYWASFAGYAAAYVTAMDSALSSAQLSRPASLRPSRECAFKPWSFAG
jgi:NhaP-type Na+/H+ or K+/H+ antiporter